MKRLTDEQERIVAEFDEIGVSERKVMLAEGMTSGEIDREMSEGMFPPEIMTMNGMRYWRLGDLFRRRYGIAW